MVGAMNLLTSLSISSSHVQSTFTLLVEQAGEKYLRNLSSMTGSQYLGSFSQELSPHSLTSCARMSFRFQIIPV